LFVLESSPSLVREGRKRAESAAKTRGEQKSARIVELAAHLQAGKDAQQQAGGDVGEERGQGKARRPRLQEQSNALYLELVPERAVWTEQLVSRLTAAAKTPSLV
jgi:hypothetical protein